MRYKATFLTGLAAGYVLGARAGRERYEAIVRSLRRVSEDPRVQETAGLLQAQASEVAASAKRTVTKKISSGSGGGTDSGTATTTTATTTTTTPTGTGYPSTNGGPVH